MTTKTGNDTAATINNKKPEPTQPTKSAVVGKLLNRPRGATGAELAQATGWQPHTVRAHLSILRKKGTQLVREVRKSGEASYRIVSRPADVSAPDSAPETADGILGAAVAPAAFAAAAPEVA